MRIARILLALTALLVVAVGTAAPATAAPAVAQPIGGGSELTINGVRCMASFALRGGGGTWYLLTDGGCGSLGATAYSAGKLVGPVVGHSYPQNSHSLIEVTNRTDWVLVPYLDAGSYQIDLTGSAQAPVGSSVCTFGSATGLLCGTIYARNVTVNFPQGAVHGLVQTTICPTGVRAAPYFSGSQAQGVLFACGGGYGYLQPINEILAMYGLTLYA